MANNIKIEVTTTDNGTTKKVSLDMSKLGVEVNKVAAAQTRAAAAAHEHFDRQSKGVIGTANSTKSFSKLASTIGDGGGGLVGAYAALAANTFAITAAFLQLRDAAQVEQIFRGLEAAGARLGLTLSVTAKKVQDLSGGLLSAEQSMRSTAQVMSAGFNPAQVEQLVVAAKDASFALGRNMTDSMDRLTRGVLKLEPELLDELGIMVRLDEASTTYARSIGKTASQLTSTQKRVGFFNAVMAETTAKFGGISAAAGNSTAFDKLSATFANLTKSVFSLLNKAFKPLANMFSASGGALLGLLLVFAGSIKGQVLPGLVNMGSVAVKAAEKTALLVAQTNAATIANSNYVKSIKDKGFHTFVNELGTAGKTVQELESEILRLQGIMNNPGKRSKVEVNAYRGTIETLQKIQVEQGKVEALTTRSNAIQAASTGNLKEAFSQLRVSVIQYEEALILADTTQTKFTKGARIMKTTGFLLSGAFKIMAVSVINFLPYIGLLVIAFGFIKEAIDNLLGKSFKDYNEALKTHAEILDGLKTKETEYYRLVVSQGSVATRRTQQLVIMSNSMNEVVSSLIDLNNKEEDLNWAGRATARAKKLSDQFDETANGFLKLAAVFMGKTALAPLAGVNENTIEAANSIKTVEKLLKSGTPEIKRLLKEGLGSNWRKEISEGKKTAADLESVLLAVQKRLEGIGQAAQDVQSAFKELENATTDFIKSAAPTTPYDTMVTNLDTISSKIDVLKSKLKEGSLTGQELSDVLSGIGENSSGLLLPETAANLNTYRETAEVVADLESRLFTLTDSEKIKLKTSLEYLRANQNIAVEVESQLNAQESVFRNLQAQDILMQNIVKLEQARLGTLNGIEDRTGAVTAARLRGENKIKQIQIDQLNNRITQLQALIDNIKAQKQLNDKKLEGLKIDKDASLEANYQMLRLRETNSLLEAQAKLRAGNIPGAVAAQRAANDSGNRANGLEAGRNIANLTRDMDAAFAKMEEWQAKFNAARNSGSQAAMETAQREMNAAKKRGYELQEQIRLARIAASQSQEASTNELGVQSLQTEVQSLQISQTSEAIIKLEAKIQLQEASLAYAQKELDILELTNKNKQIQADIDRIISGRIDNQIDRYEAVNRELKTTINNKKAILQQELALVRAREAAQQQRITENTNLSATDKKSLIAASNEIINQEVRRVEIAGKQLDLQLQIAQLQALEIPTLEQLNQKVKERLDLQLEIASSINANAIKEMELAQQRYENEQKLRGIEVNPYIKWKQEKDLAERKLIAAQQEASLKEQILKAEYSLLKAKLFTELKIAEKQLEVLRNTPGADSALINAIDGEVAALISMTSPGGLLDQQLQANINGLKLIVSEAQVNLDRLSTMEFPVGSLTQFSEQVKVLGEILGNLDFSMPFAENLQAAVVASKPLIDKLVEDFKALGPQGEMVASLLEGSQAIASSVANAMEVFSISSDHYKTKAAEMAAQITASAQIISNVLSTIASVLQSSAKAKIDNIDREIAAEQKRDGKSAESVAKIASLEKKKDAIARKSFETNKKLQMANAIVSTAAAVANAYASLPFPANIILAGLFAALGAAQVAIIAGTSYQSSGTSSANTAASASTLSIGSRGNSVDLARNNPNAGGEAAYVTGGAGSGTDASNYVPRGAYGTRSNGRAGIVVGEKGPEIYYPDTPGTVVPNGSAAGQPAQQQVHFNIQALDADGVEDILINNRGSIIRMLREAANANGEKFLEDVNVATFARRRKL